MSTVASPTRPPPPLRPLPALPHMHLLRLNLLVISVLTVTVAVGGAAGGALDLRRRQAAGRTRRGGGVGGQAEPPAARGSASYFFFSLCLLQDLKGQSRPRRGARRPPFLRSPDALCGPARPVLTRSTGYRPPGIFRSTPGSGQRGSRTWLGRPGARLFLQSDGEGNKTTQQLLSHPKVGSRE